MRMFTSAYEGAEDILELPACASSHSVIKKVSFKNATAARASAASPSLSGSSLGPSWERAE